MKPHHYARIGKAFLTRKVPVYAHYGITHRCDLTCKMCGIWRYGNRKEELELDIKEKKRLLEDIDYERRKEIESIERELESVTGREAELRGQVAEMNARLIAAPQDIEMLRMENQVLREEIEELRSKLVN